MFRLLCRPFLFLSLLGLTFPHASYGLELTVKRTIAMMPTNTTETDYRKFLGRVGSINDLSNEITDNVYMKSDNAISLENTIDDPVLRKPYKMIGRHKALYVSGIEDVPILNKHKVYTNNAMVQSEYVVQLLSYKQRKADILLSINDEVLSGNNRSGFVNIKASHNTILQEPVIAKAAERVEIKQLAPGQEFVYYVLPKIEEDTGIQRMVFYQIWLH